LENSGDYVEATLVSEDVVGAAKIGIVSAADAQNWQPTDKTTGYLLHVTYQNTVGLTVVKKGTGTVYTSGALTATFMRIRVMLSGTEVRFYWDYTGPASVPFYVHPIGPASAVVPIFNCTGTQAEVRNAIIGQTGSPSVVYSVEQQTADFGSAQSSVKVRCYQISAIVGRGDYGERTI
jgi:hypothetical protein